MNKVPRLISQLLGLLLLLLLLAGCGAAPGEEPSASQLAADDAAAVETTEAPALTPLEPEETEGQEMAEETTGSGATRPEQAEAAEPVAPVVVDLSQVTAEPVTGDEPREMPAPGVPDPLVALVHKMSQDLANRLSVDVGDVKTVETRSVDWRDSSLGCPQPGQMYMTVITPGYEVVLEVQGKRYIYHADMRENFVTCENPEPGLSPTKPDS